MRQPPMNPMCRSFGAPQGEMQEKREGAYPLRYLTERLTQQIGLRRPNPKGNGIVAIGAAGSSEAA